MIKIIFLFFVICPIFAFDCKIEGCSNHGVCKSHKNISDCLCDDGYISNYSTEKRCNIFITKDKLFYNRLTCSNSADCNSNGFCDDDTCICFESYTTLPNAGPEEQCSYKRKSQSVAFLLHFFLGYLGVGHFYIGNINYAMGQLSLTILIPIGICLFGLCFVCFICLRKEYDGNSNVDTSNMNTTGIEIAKTSKLLKEKFNLQNLGISVGSLAGILIVLSIIAMTVWWIVDCFMFGFNEYLDGNGIRLKPW